MRRCEMHDFIRLIVIAWEECQHDIFDAVRLYMGMVIGAIVVGLLFLYNHGAYWLPYLPESELTSIGVAAVMYSLFCAYIGALFLVTQILVWVILLEYAYAFTKVCYHYDEGNWAFVKVPRMIPEFIGIFLRRYVLPGVRKTRESDIRRSQILAEKIRSFKNKEEL